MKKTDQSFSRFSFEVQFSTFFAASSSNPLLDFKTHELLLTQQPTDDVYSLEENYPSLSFQAIKSNQRNEIAKEMINPR